MAKPYKEGSSWSIRLSIHKERIYISGFSTKAEAQAKLDELALTRSQAHHSFGKGPFKTCLAEAYAIYAKKRLPYLKGAWQDANRINRYLRAANLPSAHLTPVENTNSANKTYWHVSFASEPQRCIPNSLKDHRQSQAKNSAKSDAIRKKLAVTPIADITPWLVQELIDAMMQEGSSAANIANERAELRRLFTFTQKTLYWSHPLSNPVSATRAPTVDNKRNRVLTNAEWRRISKSLLKYPNPHVFPFVCLMLETAMRSCEPLRYATWDDVKWDRNILTLKDSKTGQRDVPLNPHAIALLEELHQSLPISRSDNRLFPTTYEAIKKAWRTACKEAEVHDVRLHDLRHTAATRYAHEFNGHLPYIMQITGHKTVVMAMRYIHTNADDVAQAMHGGEPNPEHLSAGYKMPLRDTSLLSEETTAKQGQVAGKVLHIDFQRSARSELANNRAVANSH